MLSPLGCTNIQLRKKLQCSRRAHIYNPKATALVVKNDVEAKKTAIMTTMQTKNV
jgi:hypothetical protein